MKHLIKPADSADLKKILRRDKKKRPKMKVSGKSVWLVKKIRDQKNRKSK